MTHDGPIVGQRLFAAFGGVILAGIAWSYGAGAGWLIGIVLCGALMASRMNPAYDLWLEGDVLVSRRGLHDVRRLSLREVRFVYIDSIPGAGDTLELRGDDVQIGLLALDDRSADLRRAIGRLVPAAVVARGRARDLLFLSGDH